MHTFMRILMAVGMILLVSHCNQISQPQDMKATAINQLLGEMTIKEKIGQLQLHNSPDDQDNQPFLERIRNGQVGAVLNEARPEVIRKIQKAAVEESRLGIPLLFGRDVIHGFKTIFPVNIGLAATFNPELIKNGAQIAAAEATSVGINWNFAPMVDVSRDPRWGRIAESFGEDPLLVTEMGMAMLEGFQGNDLSLPHTLAACAKHFVGYAAAEGGRDYNTTNIPEVELWNTYFKPFKALNDHGIASFMTGFNELNGVPATGNKFLFREILKNRWKYNGFVVSDWNSINEMIAHGFAADSREAGIKAMQAGVDMEMASTAYADHLESLIRSGEIPMADLDDAVRRILEVKFSLGLFENPYADPEKVISTPPAMHLEAAKESAIQSFVLLKNENGILPLKKQGQKVAVIGPMANDRYEQMGTWVFDGDSNLSITPLMALNESLGKNKVFYSKGLKTSRDMSHQGFPAAVEAAKKADVTLVFAGEEAIITGEAHCRAYLDLPGAQNDLIREVARTGTPVILVIMTSRPLTIGEISSHADAVIYAWHPGNMAGPALFDVLFGKISPSGKLPVTFPKATGQIPIYYAHKNTGRPADKDSFIPIQDIPVRSNQTSLGNTSHYLDVGFTPLYPFGFGLSYTKFEYSALELSSNTISKDGRLTVSVRLSNTGAYDADEVVQLYIRDKVASITRPVKELKGFKRVSTAAGEIKTIEFVLTAEDLGFYDSRGDFLVEPGEFDVWVGGSSEAKSHAVFHVTD